MQHFFLWWYTQICGGTDRNPDKLIFLDLIDSRPQMLNALLTLNLVVRQSQAGPHDQYQTGYWQDFGFAGQPVPIYGGEAGSGHHGEKDKKDKKKKKKKNHSVPPIGFGLTSEYNLPASSQYGPPIPSPFPVPYPVDVRDPPLQVAPPQVNHQKVPKMHGKEFPEEPPRDEQPTRVRNEWISLADGIERCPPGFFMSAKDGLCEAVESTAPNVVCPGGYDEGEDGCVGYVVEPPTKECPQGYFPRGKNCVMEKTTAFISVCPHDSIRNGMTCTKDISTEPSNVCYVGSPTDKGCEQKITSKPIRTCPDNFALMGDMCHSKSITHPVHQCPDGHDLVGDHCPHSYNPDSDGVSCVSKHKVSAEKSCKQRMSISK
eukprot:GHVH01002323.1.p1 GENE.GHVH01002323.1~~GHVH01002323.1.p1  ORF type:complete len:373 (-),score=36.55 GHVH01002323.1:1058-2176(-)